MSDQHNLPYSSLKQKQRAILQKLMIFGGDRENIANYGTFKEVFKDKAEGVYSSHFERTTLGHSDEYGWPWSWTEQTSRTDVLVQAFYLGSTLVALCGYIMVQCRL